MKISKIIKIIMTWYQIIDIIILNINIIMTISKKILEYKSKDMVEYRLNKTIK